MEFLQALYQQRLDSLTQTFLRMLQQLQKTISPFTEPMLAPYRVQYLEHIITTTLKDQKEQFIAQLSQEINELRSQLSKKSQSSINLPLKDYSMTTGSRDSIYEKDLSELPLRSPKLSEKTKKMSSLKNPHYLEQTYFDGQSSLFDDNATSKLKHPRKDSQSLTSIKLDNVLRSRYEVEERESEDQEFELKYLKVNKNRNRKH